MMDLPVQSVKIMTYMTIFTMFSVAVLVTGKEKASYYAQKASQYRGSIQTETTSRKGSIGILKHELQSLNVFVCSLLTIYALADLKKIEIITSLISENIFYIIIVWCLVVAGATVLSYLISKLRPHYLQLYFLVAIDTINAISRFAVGCVRVQIQLFAITIPAIVALVVPYYNWDISVLLWLIILFGAACYSIVLIFTIIVMKSRANRKMMVHDLAYLLSSLAMVGIIFNYNYITNYVDDSGTYSNSPSSTSSSQ